MCVSIDIKKYYSVTEYGDRFQTVVANISAMKTECW